MQPNASEINWVERLSEGSPDREAAVEELRTLLVRGLRKSLNGRGADDSFCDDIAHDSVLKVLDKMHTFEGRSLFTTWAMSIAIRTGISAFRKRHFKDVSLDAITEDGLTINLPSETQPSPGDRMLHRSMLEKLQELIDQDLTEKQRVVVRALLGGMPVEEIAARTNSNRNAVYKMFHDARSRLKKGFIAANYSSEDLASAFANN